ncbi:hypothetical protein KUTeg_013757 [Tegillarca granosa]|uniref:Transmembrane protein n=1 Tax=Tegillarca granosa TaxID=220873 RepID=A0ABQ9EUL2_TEGGR|nr:hypothetical protein KUTeg_013757 [Tegillarca granosa]
MNKGSIFSGLVYFNNKENKKSFSLGKFFIFNLFFTSIVLLNNDIVALYITKYSSHWNLSVSILNENFSLQFEFPNDAYYLVFQKLKSIKVQNYFEQTRILTYLYYNVYKILLNSFYMIMGIISSDICKRFVVYIAQYQFSF